MDNVLLSFDDVLSFVGKWMAKTAQSCNFPLLKFFLLFRQTWPHMKLIRTLLALFIFLFATNEVSAQLTAASNFVFTNIQTTQFTVSWTNGSGTGRLVTVRASPNSVAYPVDFTNYSTSTTFALGQNLGSSNYCAYKGTASSITIYGLTSGTYYTVSVFEYTGTSTSPNFTTSPYGSAGQYALVAQPVTQCSAMAVSNITTNGATLSWTAGSGSRELVTVKYATTNTNTPTDGTDYISSSSYGSGDAVGGPPYSYAVYDATSTSVTVSNCGASSNFTANAFTFDGVMGQNNYLTTSYPTVGFTTLATEPTSCATNLEVRDVESDAFTVSWANATTGGGAYHLVLINSTSASDIPLDATIYTGSTTYGSGNQIGSSYVVYSGSANGVRVTNLALETDYTIRVFEYNGYNGTFNPITNYLTSSYAYAVRTTNTPRPTTGSTTMNFTSVTPTSATVNWTSGNGQQRIVTAKPNRRPTALSFDGTNDYVVVPYNSALQPTAAVTLEAWAYRSAWTATASAQYIAGNGENGGYCIFQSGSFMYFYVYRNGSWGTVGVYATHLTPGWHHFTLTYDGRYTRGMIDGTIYGVNDAGANYPIQYTYSNAFMIGADPGTTTSPTASTYFNGLIDEVRVWNTSQYYWNVEANRWLGLYGNESGLAGYWRLDEGMSTTTTASNSTVTLSNLDGTLTNMTSAAATSYTPASGWAYSSSPVNQPIDFYSYSSSSVFGTGTQIGNNTWVTALTTGNSVNVTGLSPGTYYTFTVTEYNDNGTFFNYDTPRMLVGEVTTTSSAVPVITNMTPTSGQVGTLVTLTGTGFSTTLTDNIVYFGATRGAVSTASATQLQVVVPYGANNNPVSVQVNGLTGTYTREFNITSSCSNVINSSSFTASSQATSGATYGNTVKDWSNDGRSDILVTSYPNSAVNSYFAQSINGTNPPVFTANTYGTGANPYFLDCADMDGDAKNDLIVTTTANSYVTVYRGTNSSFVSASRVDLPCNGIPSQVDVADFDGDGKLDILVGYGSSAIVTVFRNTSSSNALSFGARMDIATTVGNYAIAARDMDGDGKADIAYGHFSAANFSVLRSTGTPGTISFAAAQTFSTSAGNVYSMTFGDFNVDGKPDIAVGLSNNTVRIYNNTSTVGTINYSFATSLTTMANAPYSLATNDYDGDGRHDLAVGYGSSNSVSIFEATGNFSFGTRVDIVTAGTSSIWMNSGDFNQDGKPDIVTSTSGSTINILTNDIDPLAGEPTTPSTALSVSGQTQTALTLNFTAGNGFNRIVTCRQGSPIVNTPFDAAGYAANSVFGSGTNLGGATYCVYNGTGNSVTVTGLTSNSNYYFAVYEYNSNGSACTNNYLLTSATTNGVTLNTPPTLNAISNPSPICQNSGLQTVNFSGVGTGSAGETQTLTVTAVSSNTGLIPNPSVTYTSPNPTGSLSYTPVAGQYGTSVITVTVNDGAANNNTIQQTFTVTVTQQPTTSNAGPDQNVCVGTATLAANAPAVGTGTWSVVSSSCGLTTGNLGNVNTPNTTLNAIPSGCTTTLRWTVTSGNCTASTDDVVITRGACPLTAGFTWSPSTICATPSQINNISFTDQSFAPSSTIMTWNWTFAGPITPNPSSSTQQNPANIQFTGPGSFTVTLTITDNASGNSNVTHTITITPYPSASGVISGSTTVCQGATLVPYSVAAIPNATTYNWTLPFGATIASGSGTNNILVDFSNSASSGALQVQGQNSCGVGASSAPFNVTVLPLPGVTSSISGPLSVCQGQTGVVFSTPGIANATSYNWTLPPGATITSSPTASTITVDFSAVASGGMVNVIGVNSCGNGSSSVGLTISMNPLPDVAGSITGTATVCEGTTGVTYSVPSILNATTYNWTLPPGAVISSGTGTNSIIADFTNATGSGNVTVAGVNSCGSGTSASLAVSVGLLPDSSTAITGPTTVCAGSTGVQYSISSVVGASSYNWTLPVGATIIADNGNSITVNFSSVAQSGPVSVYGVNVCGNGAVGPGITVTVNPLPDTTTTISGPATVCQGDTGVVFSISSAANATNYGWTLPAGALITSGDSTSSITVSFTGSAVSGPIYVSGHNGCGFGVGSDTIQLIVNPLPDAATAISGSTTIPICPAATGVVFSVGAINNATGYTWTLPAGATIVAGSGTNAITVDFTAAAASGAVMVTGTNGCGSGDSSFLNFAVESVTPVDICMVTVNGPSSYNHVMWDKPTVADIDSFRVYREITSNNYAVVGTVDYDSLSLFVDSIYVPVANPNSTFQRYKISAIDSCGNESAISTHHRTLFMQASVGTSGEANLSWSLYEGQNVDYYRIIRDSTLSGNWQVIDSVPGTNWVYTDWSPPTTVPQCRYRIQTVWQASCNPTRNIITSESNLEDLIVNGIHDNNGTFVVQLYPNPTSSTITVVTPASSDGVTYEVMDAAGRVVMTKKENSGANGQQVTTLDLSALADGAYTIVITVGDLQQHEKVILQK